MWRTASSRACAMTATTTTSRGTSSRRATTSACASVSVTASSTAGTSTTGWRKRRPAGLTSGLIVRDTRFTKQRDLATICFAETSDEEAAVEKTATTQAATSAEGSESTLTPAEAVKAAKAKDKVQFSVTSGITEDDMAAMQKYAQSEGVERIIRGALIEARLIEWPGPSEALFTTLIVIVMVTGSAGVLFILNTVLAQASELLFLRN